MPGGEARARKLALTGSLVEDNHEMGVFVEGSDATVAATVVRATGQAPSGPVVGDGLLVSDRPDQSSVTLLATLLTANAAALP